MNTVIQTRIDTATRQNAEKVLNAMGLTLNDGIRIFLNQVIQDRGFPFRPRIVETPNSELKKRLDNVAKKENLVEIGTLNNFKRMCGDL